MHQFQYSLLDMLSKRHDIDAEEEKTYGKE